MDDLKGEVIGEELHECTLWNDIFSADLLGEDVLLLNISVYRSLGVLHDLGCFVCRDSVGKVSKSLFHVCFEVVLALVCDRDITFHNVLGIHLPVIIDHHRLLCRLGVEEPHGDLFSLLGSFLLQIGFCILTENDIPCVSF